MLGQGVNVGEIGERFDAYLDEPLADEISADEYEMRRRQKIALENQGKIEKMIGIGRLERTRDASQWSGEGR